MVGLATPFTQRPHASRASARALAGSAALEGESHARSGASGWSKSAGVHIGSVATGSTQERERGAGEEVTPATPLSARPRLPPYTPEGGAWSSCSGVGCTSDSAELWFCKVWVSSWVEVWERFWVEAWLRSMGEVELWSMGELDVWEASRESSVSMKRSLPSSCSFTGLTPWDWEMLEKREKNWALRRRAKMIVTRPAPNNAAAKGTTTARMRVSDVPSSSLSSAPSEVVPDGVVVSLVCDAGGAGA
mmetsp:Transcript_24583/g.58045  ORF Transcript_24583/g.58045 Transcript_24583/m.58045 type:complete len:247 (-) Transcript_24583:73-813(-)